MTKPIETDRLPVMEIFYSIQGEGFHSGKPSIFLRLGGCDVGCHWCDVKESWNAHDHPSMSIDEIVLRLSDFGSKTVIVTGGEPAMYELTALTEQLKKFKYQLHIETSGAYELTGQWDWITFSPKKFKKPVRSIFSIADELKPIIFNQSDFAFAESFTEYLKEDCQLFLQPEWSRSDQMTPFILDYVKSNPKWSISLQTHKYLNIP